MSFMRRVHRKQLEHSAWYNTDIEYRIGHTMHKVKELHKKLYGTGISVTVPTNRNQKNGFLSWALNYYSHLRVIEEKRKAKEVAAEKSYGGAYLRITRSLRWFEGFVKGIKRQRRAV